MWNPFKKKVYDKDPPDIPQGKVEFCYPVQTKEIFDKAKDIDNFINNINKEKNG